MTPLYLADPLDPPPQCPSKRENKTGSVGAFLSFRLLFVSSHWAIKGLTLSLSVCYFNRLLWHLAGQLSLSNVSWVPDRRAVGFFSFTHNKVWIWNCTKLETMKKIIRKNWLSHYGCCYNLTLVHSGLAEMQKLFLKFLMHEKPLPVTQRVCLHTHVHKCTTVSLLDQVPVIVIALALFHRSLWAIGKCTLPHHYSTL